MRVVFCGLLERIERLRPHLVKMSAEARHTFGIKVIKPASSLFDISHETYILQHLQVLRNSRTSDGQGPRQFIDGDGAGGELLKDGHARGVGKGIESGL